MALLSETVGVGMQLRQASRSSARPAYTPLPPMTRALALALVLLASPSLAKPPRLTLFIAVDALGTDLLLRSRPQLKAFQFGQCARIEILLEAVHRLCLCPVFGQPQRSSVQ